MGLDIAGFSHLRYVCRLPKQGEDEQFEADLKAQGLDPDEVVNLYPNAASHAAQMGETEPGCYAKTERSEEHEFRAGSYSGYNQWREWLAQFAHGVPASVLWKSWSKFQGKPFVELIDFTDCDGRIGATVAAKLAADFKTHADRAKEFAATLGEGEGEYFLEVYADFTTALELAARNGALIFN